MQTPDDSEGVADLPSQHVHLDREESANVKLMTAGSYVSSLLLLRQPVRPLFHWNFPELDIRNAADVCSRVIQCFNHPFSYPDLHKGSGRGDHLLHVAYGVGHDGSNGLEHGSDGIWAPSLTWGTLQKFKCSG